MGCLLFLTTLEVREMIELELLPTDKRQAVTHRNQTHTHTHGEFHLLSPKHVHKHNTHYYYQQYVRVSDRGFILMFHPNVSSLCVQPASIYA